MCSQRVDAGTPTHSESCRLIIKAHCVTRKRSVPPAVKKAMTRTTDQSPFTSKGQEVTPARQTQLDNHVPSLDNISPLFKKHFPSPCIPCCKMWQIFILRNSLRKQNQTTLDSTETMITHYLS